MDRQLDNMAVAGYVVIRNGTQIATTLDPRFTDNPTGKSTTFTYSVLAYDGAGNSSVSSDSGLGNKVDQRSQPDGRPLDMEEPGPWGPALHCPLKASA